MEDSHDSSSHASGALASGSIALAEVQGYAYAAYRAAAGLAKALARPDEAVALEGKAAKARAFFENAFWCERLNYYVLALDGEKRLPVGTGARKSLAAEVRVETWAGKRPGCGSGSSLRPAF